MGKYYIPNLGKACAVLELVSAEPGQYGLKQIAVELAIPRTTALRITETLVEANYLEKSAEGAFTLGTALVKMGVKALDQLDIRRFARPVLQALAEQTGESTHLAVLNGPHSLLIEVADSPHPVRIASRPGTLVDVHCSATGKVFLAFSVPEPARFCEGLNLISHTVQTDASVSAVLASIEKTRAQGYAMDEEEYVLGVRCIAAPVTNAFGKTIAAIGITASTSTFTTALIDKMAKRVMTAAAEISKNMGLG